MPSSKNHPQIVLLVNGDVATMEMLYQILLPKFTSYVCKNSGTVNDAEEVFQDALFQLITRANLGEVQINGNFEAYVFTVCRNLWFKELKIRKKGVRNDGVFELKDETQNHIDGIIQQERWDIFEDMLQKLSEKCRMLLKDYFNKVPYNEIVKKFSYATENAAFQRVFKCKKRLMDLVKKNPKYKQLQS